MMGDLTLLPQRERGKAASTQLSSILKTPTSGLEQETLPTENCAGAHVVIKQ